MVRHSWRLVAERKKEDQMEGQGLSVVAGICAGCSTWTSSPASTVVIVNGRPKIHILCRACKTDRWTDSSVNRRLDSAERGK